MRRVFFLYSFLLLALSSPLNAQEKPIHVQVKGEGQNILFLPGFTNPGQIWNDFYTQLPGEWKGHFVTYAGFDKTEPISFPWYPQLKEALREYVVDQDLKEVVLIGHSMGGNLAIDLAHDLPDRVAKLILVDTLPCMRELMFPGFTADQMVYESPFNQRTLSMKASDFQAMAQGMAQQMTKDLSQVEQLSQWILDADRKTYVYGYTDLLKLDQRTLLPEIQAKTLLLGATEPFGEQALINLEKQYAALAQKELVMVEESRHFILFDQKDKMNTLINAFIND